MWIAETFKSAKAVIEYENKNDGTIIGNGVIDYPCEGLECFGTSRWRVPFTMRVDTKDDRFRLTFTNVNLELPPPYYTAGGSPVTLQGDWDAIKPRLLAFGDQLASSISKGKGSKNW